MINYSRVYLDDIVESLDYGVTASAENSPLGPRFLRITDIQNGSVNWLQVPWCRCSDREASERALIPGDIVFARTGATTGKSFLLREVPEDAVFASYLIRIRLGQKADPAFVNHFFNSSDYWKQIHQHSRGAAQPGINASVLRALQIPLPPLEEQRRIAAILDKAQCIRAKAARRTDLLLALGRSLFIRSFGVPSENPYQLPLFKLIDICNPKQWPTIASNQLQDNGYPVFGANGLIGYFDSFNHPEPTVLVTCRGATCGTVNISPPNCYVTGNSMAMDNPNPELLTTEYLAWVLRLRGMNDVISGSAQPQITRQGLETVTIPVPSIEAQNDFAKELSAVARVTATSRLSENSICGVADSLSARLFESSRK